jgi:hypothetical protein
MAAMTVEQPRKHGPFDPRWEPPGRPARRLHLVESAPPEERETAWCSVRNWENEGGAVVRVLPGAR